jgi:DNA-binding CsgD family transcriptional regulator
MDLCAAARTIRDHVAPNLPARLAADMSLTTITATGRRIIMSATWGLTEAQYREQLKIRHISEEQFAAHLQRLTTRLACSSKPEAAFVTLGGEIEYHYVASDGYPIAAPVVRACR